MELIKQREKKRKEVIAAAKRWASSLDFRTTAILIGSYSRGDFNLWSDVDILLISDEFKGSPLCRLGMLDPPAGIQAIPLNNDEFKRLLERGDILVREALMHGILLRDDLGMVKTRRRRATRDVSD